MKKILFLLAFVIISVFANASIVTTLQPGLTLEQDSDRYIIHFIMSDYQVVEETVQDWNGNFTFSRISPSYNYFYHLNEDGRPALPFYFLFLTWPRLQTWNVTYTINSSETISLDYDYIPAQSHSRDINILSYDQSYYGSYDIHWHWDECDIHRVNFGFQSGIFFSLFPFHYEPSNRELTIVTEATYEIRCSNNSLLSDLEELISRDIISATSLFDNITQIHASVEPEDFEGASYLIIAADQWCDDVALNTFVSHKESLGYYVQKECLGNIGSSAEDIRTFIQSTYNDCNLKYVLLVGDISDIPYSNGYEVDMDDPPTDIYYACLDSVSIYSQSYDLSPDVYVGRWPINNDIQLCNIVYKTIKSDNFLGLHLPDRIAIFTGSGDYEDSFYDDGIFLFDNIVSFSQNYYTGVLYDGRSTTIDGLTLETELTQADTEYDPTWLFIYSGHSHNGVIGLPYAIYAADIEQGIPTATLPYQSFGFAFTCLLGNLYVANNFVNAWIGSPDGGVTFLASTTRTPVDPDKDLIHVMFNQIKYSPAMSIGEFTTNGIAKYYNAEINIDRFNEAKRYVLYGDPSLYLSGITFLDVAESPNRQHRNLELESNIISQHDENLIINPSFFENIQSVQLLSVTGQLLRSSSTNNLNLQELSAGLYIVIIKSDNQLYSKTFIIK